jgi:thioredoxin reductase (NADPH)
MTRKTIILGSGCAGSTAAIYAARANLDPLVLEGHEPGGQLSLTTLVENFPGFPEGVMGPELVDNMKKQAQRFGAEYRMEGAVRVDLDKSPFIVETNAEQYETHSIIVASGASARFLGLESEKKLVGRGVSTCATCDGYFFRGQKVVVVGGGDTAMEDALFLTKHAEKVTVIHRRDELRASKFMAARAMANPKMEFLWDTVLVDILDVEKGAVEAVQLKNVKTGEDSVLETHGVFVAIGHKPNTEIFEGKLETDENGYLIVKNGSKTAVEGVFVAGDVHDHEYRQAITAAGAGCRAAIDCERYLQLKGID